MAAKKKTLQETRKEYVQAKIATNSASKNPAKLRQEFNTKAATVKGRTEIVQTLGVAGTPQAQMLRATLRNFPTASTGASKPVVTNNVNLPSNNSASSAVIKRVDAGYTPSYPGVNKPSLLSTSTKRVDPGYTPSYPSTYVPSDAARFVQNKNVPGVRLVPKILQEADKGNYLGAIGRTALAAGEIRLATKFVSGFAAQFAKNVAGATAKGIVPLTKSLTKTMGKTPGALSQKAPRGAGAKLASRGTGAKVAARGKSGTRYVPKGPGKR